MSALVRRMIVAALAAMALGLVAVGSAAGHGGGVARAGTDQVQDAVRLHRRFLTVALVPRPREALEAAIPSPPDLTRTFYGSDPLVPLWGLSCGRASLRDVRTGRLALSIVAVPTGLTDPGSPPLANNFDHLNRFAHRPPGGGPPVTLGLRTRDAVDRFCFPAAGGCSAAVTTAPGSAARRMLGRARPAVRVAFDHRRIARLDLPF